MQQKIVINNSYMSQSSEDLLTNFSYAQSIFVFHLQEDFYIVSVHDLVFFFFFFFFGKAFIPLTSPFLYPFILCLVIFCWSIPRHIYRWENDFQNKTIFRIAKTQKSNTDRAQVIYASFSKKSYPKLYKFI